MTTLTVSTGNAPDIRTVDGYCENGSFFIMTHALSGKAYYKSVLHGTASHMRLREEYKFSKKE